MEQRNLSDLARQMPAAAAEGLSDLFRSISTFLSPFSSVDVKGQGMAKKLDRRTPDPTDEPDKNTRRGSGFENDPFTTSFTAVLNDPYEQYFSDTSRPLSRREQYALAHRMDAECTVVSRALDAAMSNVCGSEDGSDTTFKYGSNDDNCLRIMQGLNERATLADGAPAVVRSTIKYGDKFKEVVADNDGLIWDFSTLPPGSISRVEQGGKLIGFYQVDQMGGVHADWGPRWVVHVRHNLEDGALYGRSQMYPARRSFTQISYLEDHTVIMVIDRAGQKRVHNIAIRQGDDGEKDKDNYIKANIRKNTWDDSRNKYSNRYRRPAGADFINAQPIGMKEYPQTGITTLDGQGNYDQVIVVNKYYLRNVAISMGVPLALVGLEEDVNARATLAVEKVEFGRMVRRMQSVFANAYKLRMFGYQFSLLGMDVPETDYWVKFPVPDMIDEKIQADVLKITSEAALRINNVYPMPIDVFLHYFVGWEKDRAVEVANAMGAPSSESEGLKNKKQRELFQTIRERIHKDPEFEQFMGDALVAVTNAADYFEEYH